MIVHRFLFDSDVRVCLFDGQSSPASSSTEMLDGSCFAAEHALIDSAVAFPLPEQHCSHHQHLAVEKRGQVHCRVLPLFGYQQLLDLLCHLA